MTGVKTRIRIVNVATGQVSHTTSPFPQWLVVERLRELPKLRMELDGSSGFGRWDCMVYIVQDLVVLRMCPAGLEETLDRLHQLAEVTG